MSEGRSFGEGYREKYAWEHVLGRIPEPRSLEWLGPFAQFWADAVEEQNLSYDLQRTSYWSSRLMFAMDERADPLFVPGYRFNSYGFLINPETGEYDFGVVLNAALGAEERIFALEPITVDDEAFPVAVRNIDETVHSPMMHPQWGTGGCWATSRRSSSARGPGVLTAKHVVAHNVGSSPGIGDPISMSDQSMSHVLDLGPDGIDAALISTTEPVGNMAVSMGQLVAPWTDVTFEGSASRAHTTWVTSVTDTRGVFSSVMPARVILAESGLGGDSGALVNGLNDASAGVGIYIGELTDPSGRTEGIAQNGFQVQTTMDMEFYS